MLYDRIKQLKAWRGRWFGLAAVLWLGLMFWFSNQPASESSQLSGSLLLWLADRTAGFVPASVFGSPLAQTVIRKSAHFLNFAVFGVWVTLADRQRASWRLLVLGFLAAAFDEAHQIFVPGRSAELRDVLIDLTGFTVGMAFVHGVSACRSWLKQSRAR